MNNEAPPSYPESGAFREHGKKIRNNPRLIFAAGALALAVFIWALNAHDTNLSAIMLAYCRDVTLAGLGAHVAVNVSDCVQSIFQKSQEDLNQTVRTDPKDVAGLPD